MARKLLIDADFYLLPELRKAVEGTSKRAEGGFARVAVYSTDHQLTNGFKNWTIAVTENKNVIGYQNGNQHTFISEQVRADTIRSSVSCVVAGRHVPSQRAREWPNFRRELGPHRDSRGGCCARAGICRH